MVRTLIDNGKLANQIVRLAAIVVQTVSERGFLDNLQPGIFLAVGGHQKRLIKV